MKEQRENAAVLNHNAQERRDKRTSHKVVLLLALRESEIAERLWAA